MKVDKLSSGPNGGADPVLPSMCDSGDGTYYQTQVERGPVDLEGDPDLDRGIVSDSGHVACWSPSDNFRIAYYIDHLGRFNARRDPVLPEASLMSTQPCGCDKEANHTCAEHRNLFSAHDPFSSGVGAPIVSGKEVRVTDPLTGGQKGSKLQRFSLIPRDWLWALATHYGVGASKYEDRNWERGYNWSLSLDAHERHLSQWLSGERNDPETGSHHLIAAAWHLIALWWFEAHGKGTDNLQRT